MSCFDCRHSAIRDRLDERRDEILRSMFASGFIVCNESEGRATFHSLKYTCKKFAQADEKTVEARRRWAAAQEKR